MSIQLVSYLAAMAGVYAFAWYRGSFAFIWIVIYFLFGWIIEDNYQGNLALAYLGLALILVALCELLVRIDKDVLSVDAIIKQTSSLLSFCGLGPKTKLLEASDHKSLVKANKYIQQKDWRRLDKYISRLNDERRYTVIRGLTDQKARMAFIDEWLLFNPNSPIALRVSGFSYLSTGWESRGSATADLVTSKGWDGFLGDLELADQDFKKAINLNDNCYTAYIGLITIAMGAGFGNENTWKYFIRGLALSPNNYHLNSSMLHACAPKWGGDAGDMFAIAHKALEDAPEGSAVAACLAIAHVEHWLSLSMMEHEDEAENYFQQKSVKADLMRIFEILKHHQPKEFVDVEAMNVLGFCLDKAEMAVEFRALLTLMKQRYVSYPWCYSEESFLTYFDCAYAVDHALRKHGYL
jgi:hypothetical protein